MSRPFEDLTPDLVLDAVETTGVRCDGRQLALNSYENRVFMVWLEEGEPVVAKFYRPARWTDAAILEEHAFALELAAREIPVVAPVAGPEGRTLHEHVGYRFAIFPRRAGRAPELDRIDTLAWLGRFIGRIHAVGAVAPFAHRPRIDIESYGREPLAFLLDSGLIPDELVASYRAIAEEALLRVARRFEDAGQVRYLRVHGDCHVGNILWSDAGPHFVDLDDARMGPAVQDLWMLLSGDRAACEAALGHVIGGYREFCEFDPAELLLVEPLRALRMIHYAAWLGRRWDDPAFPASFPWFGTQRYWQEEILRLREQAAQLDEPPLAVPF